MSAFLSSRLARSLVMLLLMVGAAVSSWALTPNRKLVDKEGVLRLKGVIPEQFGDWKADTSVGSGVINPQAQVLIERIYTEVFTRTYVDSHGNRIMLSLAYGDDQRKGTQVHYPEVCYPAQGFEILSNRRVVLHFNRGDIRARQLETVLNGSRYEPVTYWTVVGDRVFVGDVERRIGEIAYALRGYVPDGVLFRISSIDNKSDSAFALQRKFAADIVDALQQPARRRLTGFSS